MNDTWTILGVEGKDVEWVFFVFIPVFNLVVLTLAIIAMNIGGH